MYKFPIRKESSFQVSAIVSGFSAIVVQLILLRTFLIILHGNELVIGIILGSWMLLTGLGAKLGHAIRKKESALIILHILTGIMPAILIFSIHLLKAMLFPPGILPGFLHSALFTFVALAPFCLLSGAMFTLISVCWSNYVLAIKSTQVYGIEAMGSILGSLLFALVFIHVFRVPEILVLITSANLGTAILLSLAFGRKPMTGHFVFTGLLIWILMHLLIDWYGFVRSENFKGQAILDDFNTPYGNVVITKSGDQINIFENGLSGLSSDDIIGYEEQAHYALLQVANPKKVLVISGNPAGIFNEIKKYDPAQVDFVEINPAIIQVTSTYFGLPDDSVFKIHTLDPIIHLKQTQTKYDAILLQLPPPSTLQFNRYYALEFFELAHSKLQKNGVISLPMQGGSNYLGKNMLDYYNIIVPTVKQVFQEVIILPGESNYLLASNHALSYNITKKIDTLGLQNQYVNRFYLDDDLLQTRGAQILDQIGNGGSLNKFFKPVAFFHQIRYWLSWYELKLSWVVMILVLIFTALMLVYKIPGRALFMAGFTATSVEVMALITFQVMFGYLFQALALLIPAFMAGLAAGSFFISKISEKLTRRNFIQNQALIGFSALMIPGLILLQNGNYFPEVYFRLSLYLMLGISGLLTGIQFSMANYLGKGNTGKKASTNYSADLTGSAGGAIIISVVLIPLAGFYQSGLILFGINLLVVIWMWLSKKVF